MINGLDSQYCAAVEKSKLGLRPMRVGLWNDLVFINLFVDAPFREEHMAPLNARCAAYNFLEMRHTAKGKLLIENYGESYHLPCIHQSLNDRSPMDQHKHAFVSDNHFGQITDQFTANKVDNSPFTPFLGLTRTQEFSGEYPIVFLNVIRGIQRDHFFASSPTPLPRITRTS